MEQRRARDGSSLSNSLKKKEEKDVKRIARFHPTAEMMDLNLWSLSSGGASACAVVGDDPDALDLESSHGSTVAEKEEDEEFEDEDFDEEFEDEDEELEEDDDYDEDEDDEWEEVEDDDEEEEDWDDEDDDDWDDDWEDEEVEEDEEEER